MARHIGKVAAPGVFPGKPQGKARARTVYNKHLKHSISYTPEGDLLYENLIKTLYMQAAGGIGVTMHRAFDVCRDPIEALEQCVSLGIDTILTSGQKSSAWEGREMLAELVKRADGRLNILAGAGIKPAVIEELAPCTGVSAFHMSGKKVIDSRMEFRREGVPMGIPGFSEFEVWQTSAESVSEAASVLRKLEARQTIC